MIITHLIGKEEKDVYTRVGKNDSEEDEIKFENGKFSSLGCSKYGFGDDEDQLLSIVKFDEIPEQYHDLVRQAAAECVPVAIEIEE